MSSLLEDEVEVKVRSPRVTRLWGNIKLLLVVVAASLLGIMLAGYPANPRDSFLGNLVAGHSGASKGSKLSLHKHWRPYNPLRTEKLHVQGGQRPERPE
jgi:hypothetical protein